MRTGVDLVRSVALRPLHWVTSTQWHVRRRLIVARSSETEAGFDRIESVNPAGSDVTGLPPDQAHGFTISCRTFSGYH